MTTERDPVRAALADELLPCPLCHGTEVWPGTCYTGDSTEREDAVRCKTCGCRATKKAWQSRVNLPGTPEMKLVYVKRWRTIVHLPADRADEIVEALRALPPTLNSGAVRAETISECIGELELRYPDHAWLNAACAALRGLYALALPRAVDGGAAGEREAAIHDALLGLIEAVELDSDTGGKGISGYTAARLHDARETLSAFPRSDGGAL